MNTDKTQQLPPSKSEPVAPLQPQTGELKDERLQVDITEGDEGGGHPGLGNDERRKTA